VTRYLILAAPFLALCGCTTAGAGAALTGAQLGVAIYCAGITEEAREKVREELTDGVKVIPCPEKPDQ
jgi:hypothetical protein